MITFKPDLLDIAKKVGALVSDIRLDTSKGEYVLFLANDEYIYLLKLKSFSEEASKCDTVKK